MAEKVKFVEIELPIINKKVEVIDTEGRKTIKIDLTRELYGKSLEIVFRVIKDKGGARSIDPFRVYLQGYYIRRTMRKSISYVEDSFNVECKNALLRIKPFLITRREVSRAVKKALRNKCKEEILAYVKDKKFEEIFSDILSSKFQKMLLLKLKKIYPLALCEIRDVIVEKKLEDKVEVVEEKVK